MPRFSGTKIDIKPTGVDKVVKSVDDVLKTLVDMILKRDQQIESLLAAMQPDNGPIIEAVTTSNAQMHALLASAKTPVSITNVEQPKADRWEFEVQRGSDSFISKVIATPIFNNPTRH